MVRPVGVEPTAFWSVAKRSIQLSYGRIFSRYNDIINDMDMFSRVKYTIKGPNSLGNKNSNSISAKYRGLHYSYIGRIDLTVCGNSD